MLKKILVALGLTGALLGGTVPPVAADDICNIPGLGLDCSPEGSHPGQGNDQALCDNGHDHWSCPQPAPEPEPVLYPAVGVAGTITFQGPPPEYETITIDLSD